MTKAERGRRYFALCDAVDRLSRLADELAAGLAAGYEPDLAEVEAAGRAALEVEIPYSAVLATCREHGIEAISLETYSKNMNFAEMCADPPRWFRTYNLPPFGDPPAPN